jgi:transcriptional regulator with XRE-family HTH domain
VIAFFFFYFEKATFAERLKALRKERGVSQRVLSEGLGVTITQISDLENGKTTTSIERLVALGDYFDVSLDYLTGRTDKPEVNK